MESNLRLAASCAPFCRCNNLHVAPCAGAPCCRSQANEPWHACNSLSDAGRARAPCPACLYLPACGYCCFCSCFQSLAGISLPAERRDGRPSFTCLRPCQPHNDLSSLACPCQAHIERFERYSKEPEENDDDYDGSAAKEVRLDAGKLQAGYEGWEAGCRPPRGMRTTWYRAFEQHVFFLGNFDNLPVPRCPPAQCPSFRTSSASTFPLYDLDNLPAPRYHPCAVPQFQNGRQLRDYQRASLEWMASNCSQKINCILGDEVGPAALLLPLLFCAFLPYLSSDASAAARGSTASWGVRRVLLGPPPPAAAAGAAAPLNTT
jgi:hypothetical protein